MVMVSKPMYTKARYGMPATSRPPETMPNTARNNTIDMMGLTTVSSQIFWNRFTSRLTKAKTGVRFCILVFGKRQEDLFERRSFGAHGFDVSLVVTRDCLHV